MPFIQRLVEPIYVSRFPSNAIDSTDLNQSHQQQNQQKHQNCSSENEFDTISNKTLGNVLRQLASVVLCADQIFCGLGNELYNIQKRTETIKKRIKIVGTTIENDIHDTIICKCIKYSIHHSEIGIGMKMKIFFFFLFEKKEKEKIKYENVLMFFHL